MTGKMKTRLALAGLLAGSLALGLGDELAVAEARPQDLLQQQEEDETGTTDAEGGADESPRGDGGLPPELQGPLDEPGTGGAGGGDEGTLDEGTPDEQGTGGAGDTGPGPVLDEDEGVLQPGVRDEGLDTEDEAAGRRTGDEDTR